MSQGPIKNPRLGLGLIALGLLALAYLFAARQIPSRSETGIRVIPWQAPDLEISAPSIE